MGWLLGADPITTYYQTQHEDRAIRFPSYEAAMAAVSNYFGGFHNEPQNKYRWSIRTI